jgi:hypothetical protein
MRQGRVEVSLLTALMIEKYMQQHADVVVHHLDLVSPLLKNQLKKLQIPLVGQPIELARVLIHSVQYDPTWPVQTVRDPSTPNQLRPIILDEHQRLIANPNTYWFYQQHQKKTVPAWRVSLSDLLAKKYEPAVFAQTFLLCERAAIGIAAKKCLGNRQGQRSDLELRRNVDEVKGRTDQLIAAWLGFGSKDSYRQAEKVQLLGSPALIQAVNDGKLSLFTAAVLTRFSHIQQQEALALSKRERRTFMDQYNSRK